MRTVELGSTTAETVVVVTTLDVGFMMVFVESTIVSVVVQCGLRPEEVMCRV